MGIKKVSADLIITNVDEPIANGTITYTDLGQILKIESGDAAKSGAKVLRGAICPGFINAHCHLELSHMKGLVPSGTGLIPFIKDVVTKRGFPSEFIRAAIANADQEMWDSGIQAVGDICNTIDTVGTKGNTKIKYYSFVEMFDFLQEEQASITYEQYLPVFDAMPANNDHKKSLVPHAPYSVSKNLFQIINDQLTAGSTISIHNQELYAENELFKHKTGGFIDFYNAFNIPLEHFEPTHGHSIQYTLKHLSSTAKTLMVHNTVSVEADIIAAHNWNRNTYWVTCPNANLYIENKLPYYQYFINQKAKMCIGTDSLTSNWQLDMLSEMKTIKRYQSYIDDLVILKWATINGAKALGYEVFGKILVGTNPGLVHLEGNINEGTFKLMNIEKSYRIV